MIYIFYLLLNSLGFLLYNTNSNSLFCFYDLFLGYINHNILDSSITNVLKFLTQYIIKNINKSLEFLVMISWVFTIFLLFTRIIEKIFLAVV